MFKCLSCLAIPLLLVAVLGCDSKPKTYPVSGRVMIKGEPAPQGTRVNFEPAAGGGEAAAGMVDGSGNYTLYSGSEGRAGAWAGTYKVFLAPDPSGDSYMSGAPGRPSGIPGVPSPGPIPDEYLRSSTSPLTVEVAETTNTIDVVIE
jgi:hypothetical protein